VKYDETLEKIEEQTDEVAYETPRIEDYGTLAELTAKEGPNWDLFDREGWGGYS
jgi:hypothetical protein